LKIAISVLVVLMLSATAAVAGSVGFHRGAVRDSDGKPREVGIWYPTDAPVSPQPLGPYSQTVAIDGPVVGRQLPVVVILHGVQGSFANHYPTALALADAGFVAVAVTQGDDMPLTERSRHVARVLDHLFTNWPHRDRLDPARIGLYGFSVGGFAALVTIGGVPDFGRIPAYCSEHPDRVCAILKERNVDTSVPASAWARDSRIKAAVIAAPTLAFTLGPERLAAVSVPIQLWRAGSDEITPHPRAAEAIANALPARPEYIVVPDAGHFAFVECSVEMAKRAPAICRDAPGFDRAAFQEKFNSAVVGFFRARLL